MEYIKNLLNNCYIAQKVTPVRDFEFNDLEELVGIKMAIYIIEEINGDSLDTFNFFKQYKNTGARNCSKPNSPSNILYVGSSATNLKKRIKEHIGQGSKSTYALNLGHWFRGEYKITIRQYDVSKEVLQILEDALYWEMKPAFGKLGGNNK
jgi:hypothetical protein